MYVAWPHADRVEIHIFSSDGQTRLGYFVHVFIDLSAKVLPDCEGDSSMLPGVVDQGTERYKLAQNNFCCSVSCCCKVGG